MCVCVCVCVCECECEPEQIYDKLLFTLISKSVVEIMIIIIIITMIIFVVVNIDTHTHTHDMYVCMYVCMYGVAAILILTTGPINPVELVHEEGDSGDAVRLHTVVSGEW